MFQFTHPVRGATITHSSRCYVLIVSIHAPRAGCDFFSPCHLLLVYRFNSRTPCGVRRGAHTRAHTATRFNSRTPCGVRLCPLVWDVISQRVSIHAPRAGCDIGNEVLKLLWHWFQFTHPVRGATYIEPLYGKPTIVSIHAPRAGCDDVGTHRHTRDRGFNSRTPCGVRQPAFGLNV